MIEPYPAPINWVTNYIHNWLTKTMGINSWALFAYNQMPNDGWFWPVSSAQSQDFLSPLPIDWSITDNGLLALANGKFGAVFKWTFLHMVTTVKQTLLHSETISLIKCIHATDTVKRCGTDWFNGFYINTQKKTFSMLPSFVTFSKICKLSYIFPLK